MSWIDEVTEQTPMSIFDDWMSYKERFHFFYGVPIFQHYNNDVESLKILKHEILYM